MQNKTLKTIALFGDEAVINQQKKMREARLMAEGNYLSNNHWRIICLIYL